MTARMEASGPRCARAVFGRDGPEEAQLARFLIASLPVAAVRPHLVRGEPPPPYVDRLISVTYAAVVDDYQARRGPPEPTEGAV